MNVFREPPLRNVGEGGSSRGVPGARDERALPHEGPLHVRHSRRLADLRERPHKKRLGQYSADPESLPDRRPQLARIVEGADCLARDVAIEFP